MAKSRSTDRQTPSPQAEKAVYRASRASRISTNPLVAALPAKRTDEEWTRWFTRGGKLAPLEDVGNVEECELRVSELHAAFIPTPRYVDAALDLDRLLRAGLNQRPKHFERFPTEGEPRRERILAEIKEDKLKIHGPNQLGYSIVGCVGMGKTQFLDRFVAAYRPVLKHDIDAIGHPKALQLVYLKMDAPVAKGTKGLCLTFLRAFDKAMGTTYETECAGAKAETLLGMLISLSDTHALGMLIVDELQDFGGQGISFDERVRTLVGIMNSLKIPLVVVGTPGALEVLGRHVRIVRRTNGPRWNPFDDDAQWSRIVDGLLYRGAFTLTMAKVPHAASRLHALVQGVPGFLGQVLTRAQLNVIDDGRDVVEMLDLTDAFDDMPEEFKHAINAIRLQREGVKLQPSDDGYQLLDDVALV